MAASRPVQGKREKLLRLIECPICLNELQDPRLLSCRHTLCYMCVKDYTEQGNYNKQLPCPVCRGVTVLSQGGVDDLPPFFFMNELKDVITEKDDEKDSEPQPQGGAVCSTEECGQPAVNYCKDGCQSLCVECYNDHQRVRFTKNHDVIPTNNDEVFTKADKPTYPPCKHHTSQMLDMFCRTCDLPVCQICCHDNHRGHDCCMFQEQAAVCKIKLRQLHEDTQGLIHVVKQAVDKTRIQVEQAEADINEACCNVQSTFKAIHERLHVEEQNMLSDIHDASRRVKKTADVTIDSQMVTLVSLESLAACQIKLAEKDSPYESVTVTNSIARDVEDHYGQQLPGFVWSCQMVRDNRTGELCPSGNVKVTQADEASGSREVKEVGRIRLHNQHNLLGLVVYNQYLYTVHLTGFVLYCYSKNGTLYTKYKHKKASKISVQGMCLVVDGEKPMLVISDFNNKALIWISISADNTMKHHHTQQVDYWPRGSYNEQGNLMVCAYDHKVHRYRCDGEPLEVITLPDDIIPWSLTRYGAADRYAIVDYDNKQVVVIDRQGEVHTRYKDQIQGVKLGRPCDVIMDSEGRLVISDQTENQVLLLSKEGDEVRKLLQAQHVMYPDYLHLDADNDTLYVSGQSQNDERHVFIYNYTMLECEKKINEIITTISMTVTL